MKILIFNSLYSPYKIGGAERSVQILAETLVRKGNNVHVITTCDKTYNDLINGVNVHYVHIPHIYWMYYFHKQSSWKKLLWHILEGYNPFVKIKIHGMIKEIDPDVVHTNNLAGFSPVIWKLIAQKKIPLVHTMRDYYALCLRSTMYHDNKNCKHQCRSCQLVSTIKKKYSHSVDFLVGISDFILQKHLEYGYFKGNNQNNVIYNPLPEISDIQLKKTGKIIKFSYMGQLIRSKGIEKLIRTFNEFSESKCQLNIYGKFPDEASEKHYKSIIKSDKIKFKGFQSLQSIFMETDILVVPSLWNEPFGRIVIEAFMYHVPVIVSDRGGLKELVKHKKNGLVFSHSKKDDLKNAVSWFLEHPQNIQKMKNQAYQDSHQYSPDTIAEKYLAVYSQVIDSMNED